MRLISFLLCLLILLPRSAYSDECEKLNNIYDQIASYRKLKYTKIVPCSVKNKNEVKDYLNKTFEKQTPIEKIKLEESLLKALGLIPKNYDYREELLKLYNEQVAGYYDPYTKSYSIADWIDPLYLSTVAFHELTHVLQDQNFNLLKLADPNLTTDETFAKAALIEGDATYTMYDLAQIKSGQTGLSKLKKIDELLKSISSSSNSQGSFESAPRFIKEMMLFPYITGFKFIFDFKKLYLHKDSDYYFNNPPITSSQILHPEQYDKLANRKNISCKKDGLVKEDILGEFFYLSYTQKRSERLSLESDVACYYENKVILESTWYDENIFKEVLKSFNKNENITLLQRDFPKIVAEVKVNE